MSAARENQRGIGRQSSSCRRALVQATESSANEMIRTSDAPQAKSQAGTGRSLRPTSACAEATSGKRSAATGPAAASMAMASRPANLPGRSMVALITD